MLCSPPVLRKSNTAADQNSLRGNCKFGHAAALWRSVISRFTILRWSATMYVAPRAFGSRRRAICRAVGEAVCLDIVFGGLGASRSGDPVEPLATREFVEQSQHMHLGEG